MKNVKGRGLSPPPAAPLVLGLLQFTHSRKAAFAIWCFDLTTEFQPGMLNSPSFFLPIVLIAEDVAARLLTCLHNSSIFSNPLEVTN